MRLPSLLALIRLSMAIIPITVTGVTVIVRLWHKYAHDVFPNSFLSSGIAFAVS
jgi:hypothetical protein